MGKISIRKTGRQKKETVGEAVRFPILDRDANSESFRERTASPTESVQSAQSAVKKDFGQRPPSPRLRRAKGRLPDNGRRSM